MIEWWIVKVEILWGLDCCVGGGQMNAEIGRFAWKVAPDINIVLKSPNLKVHLCIIKVKPEVAITCLNCQFDSLYTKP